jgi:hypothetical protein
MENSYTTIERWSVIEIYDDDKTYRKILFGYILEDLSGRFCPGYFVSTSPITDINNNDVTTKSGNLYCLIGPGENCKLRIEALKFVRAGFDPKTATYMLNEQNCGLKIHPILPEAPNN